MVTFFSFTRGKPPRLVISHHIYWQAKKKGNIDDFFLSFSSFTVTHNQLAISQRGCKRRKKIYAFFFNFN